MIHFLVHDEHDTVDVAVVEAVKCGQRLTDWIMDQDKEMRLRAKRHLHRLHVRAHAFVRERLMNTDTIAALTAAAKACAR